MTQTVYSLWKGEVPVTPPQVTMKGLLRETAEAHGLTVDQMLADTRKRPIAWARQDFMWRARQVTRAGGHYRWSFPIIAQFLGLQDHTTIIHGVRAHEARMREPVAA